MDKKIKDKLAAVEKHLHTAKYASFLRLDAESNKILQEAYEAFYGIPLKQSQKTCSECKLKWVKKLAEEYYKPDSNAGRKKKIKVDDAPQK